MCGIKKQIIYQNAPQFKPKTISTRFSFGSRPSVVETAVSSAVLLLVKPNYSGALY